MTVKEMIEKTKSVLRGRKHAYQQTFGGDGAPEMVLRDLAKFCRANESSFHQDPRAHAVLEGRREVWLRIEKHLNLTTDELWNIYKRKDIE